MLRKLREEVLDAALNLMKYKLITLTGGNVSGRDIETGYIAITPSGMDYEKLLPEDIVIIDIEGNTVEAKWKPSVDTSDHLYIYKHKPEVQSIIHTHSTYASCFAVLNQEIPCASTTLANEVGGTVPLAKYAPVASGDIGPTVVETIGDKRACLLANHGVMAVGPSVRHALVAAVMLEDAAKVYHLAKSIGTPVLLPDSEIQKAKDVFLNIYGQDK
ncbi:L-ribulose-5-phosphate 4-epimerase [Geosporobacter ferrireducens]|uniref:L-ribulose-5-phosphate 4-epimerase n=1 Tax=Geosporobacter ferrireducens TaxID=1424294 RepID=A0A1D8GQV4_9FIRM|nr:L-ribulose-5-phosphate 4-epimerase [Geosporobacter ferrireducens]